VPHQSIFRSDRNDLSDGRIDSLSNVILSPRRTRPSGRYDDGALEAVRNRI